MLDPSTLLTAPITTKIWSWIRSNIKWALYVSATRIWLIIVIGIVVGFLAFAFIHKKKNTSYRYIAYQLVIDTPMASLQTLEYKQKYLSLINDINNTLATEDNHGFHKEPPLEYIHSDIKGSILWLSVTTKKSREGDSTGRSRVLSIEQSARKNLPANIRLEKLADYTINIDKRDGIMILATYGGFFLGVCVVLIIASITSPWLKLKKTGLVFLGLVTKPQEEKFNDADFLFIWQNLLRDPFPDTQEIILLAGASEFEGVSALHSQALPDWKVLRIELGSAYSGSQPGLYEHVKNDVPIDQIIQHDSMGLPFITLNCPDQKEAFHLLKNKPRIQQLFLELSRYRIILLSSPSLTERPDALALLPYCTKIVLTHFETVPVHFFYKSLRLIQLNGGTPTGYIVYNVGNEGFIPDRFWA